MQKTLSLFHSIKKPTIAGSGPVPLLLLLHGLGDSESGFLGLASSLDGRFFCVSARAPHAFGSEGFAWFHVDFSRGVPAVDSSQAESSRLVLLGFIDDHVEAYGLDSKRVFVVGFSQGAMMGLSLAPVSGEIVAELVDGAPSRFDLTLLSPDRYA